MGVRQAIVRGFLKLNIFARTPHVKEESGFISEEQYLKKIAQEIKESKEYQRWKEKKGK